ncbi:pol 2 transcription elongation factor subunit [Grosmannia clavigera kw1407]|uniref:Pol 2 transcription elongation factor subunit n=1 Tax=Grosmannia clavigera (strain kw1407 / UAMH 11150) TaxID=655863 RepID=F0XUT9_GROCL|nr:pol 2 transcription elongation factor subunit [Grosmannia clavigera kw1407]EFW98593.1 pol 2 transcription elongation factor subunit [Grosmannia clavigera kw1407]
MASATATADPLLFLRQSIAAGTAVVPTTTDTADATETPLPQAKFLQFAGEGGQRSTALPVDAPTRFLSSDAPVDLRSIYFAWLNREVAIPDYNAAATRLNEELAAAGSSATVHKFAFVERLDLITWLEGASEESEYIQSAGGDKAGGVAGTGVSGAKAATGAAVPSARSGRGIILDPRLAVIYGGERRMGDHNTALRGIKPTDFSHVRKLAVPFMPKRQQQAVAAAAASADKKSVIPTALPLNPKSGAVRRPDPIILLSPSASSLLRMSNIKVFLETGHYVPPDNSSTATMLHLMRTMKEVDPARPLRFILVEGPEHFKPEYWNRVVAVFTTGQAWQFKNYKWNNPAELFKHVLGVYVGWRGEVPPPGVRDWGHRVLSCAVDKWTGPVVPGAETHRWRDREVAESIWKAIEGAMLQKGWKRDSGATLA